MRTQHSRAGTMC